jgi:hypothetical protein
MDVPDFFAVLITRIEEAVILIIAFGWIVPLIIGIRLRRKGSPRGRAFIIGVVIWVLLLPVIVVWNIIAYR